MDHLYVVSSHGSSFPIVDLEEYGKTFPNKENGIKKQIRSIVPDANGQFLYRFDYVCTRSSLLFVYFHFTSIVNHFTAYDSSYY